MYVKGSCPSITVPPSPGVAVRTDVMMRVKGTGAARRLGAVSPLPGVPSVPSEVARDPAHHPPPIPDRVIGSPVSPAWKK